MSLFPEGGCVGVLLSPVRLCLIASQVRRAKSPVCCEPPRLREVGAPAGPCKESDCSEMLPPLSTAFPGVTLVLNKQNRTEQEGGHLRMTRRKRKEKKTGHTVLFQSWFSSLKQ